MRQDDGGAALDPGRARGVFLSDGAGAAALGARSRSTPRAPLRRRRLGGAANSPTAAPAASSTRAVSARARAAADDAGASPAPRFGVSAAR